MNTASHLQTICLTENVRTDFSNLLSLVEYLRGDVRQCLLTLQFWLNSGGGSSPIRKDVVFNKKHCKSVTQSDRPGAEAGSEKDVTGQSDVKQDCEDSSKPAPVDMTVTDTITNEDSALGTAKLPVAEKGLTSVVTQNTDVKIETSSQTTKTLLPPGEGSDHTTIAAQSAPLAHGLCFESILGPVCRHGNTLQDGVLQVGAVWSARLYAG